MADLAIIGAGVVGCATARHLSLQYPSWKIVVLEKMEKAGLATSRLNSGVLHSGIHQNPKFLKTSLARKGSAMATQYMIKRGLPIMPCGMLIAISAEALKDGLHREWSNLWRLIKNGWSSGVNLQILTPWGAKRLEPQLKTMGGIFIPEVWIIDPAQLVETLFQEALASGVRFSFNNPVTAVTKSRRFYNLHTPTGQFMARRVVNAAGLYADTVAAMAGFPEYHLYPWRGEYYEVAEERRKIVQRLVYPAMPAHYPGKGIHFSPRINGQLFIGPNAKPVSGKENYEQEKTGVEEFLQAAKRFYPDLRAEDLKWAYSGIRPKLTNTAEESDFIIKMDNTSPPWVNLIGIDSPGLSAAMAIAEYVGHLFKN